MTASAIQGMVFDIQLFSIHDGPGIRTTVFLKGCPLRCLWCHNPESWKKEAQGTIGREMTVSQVMQTVLEDEFFFQDSGGGLTVSGGEPLLQAEFTEALLLAARRRGLHTAVETSGAGRVEDIERIAKAADLMLFDIKAAPEDYKRLTGAGFEPLLVNLRKVRDIGCPFWIRLPLVPDVNDTQSHLVSIAGIVNEFKPLRTEIMPYHSWGIEKRRRIGIPESSLSLLQTSGTEQIQEWTSQLKKLGVQTHLPGED